MSRILGKLRYFVGDAADEWRHSPGVNFLATATLASALFVAGLLALVLSNVHGRIAQVRSEAPVDVFLEDGISEEVRADLGRRLAAVPGVEDVRLVGKEEALRRFRDSFAGLADLVAELQTNPLPASFEVELARGADGAGVVSDIRRELARQAGVEEIRYDRAWLDRVEALLSLARVGGLWLALLVFVAVAFVMASVLRLAVYARRDEIEIMLLVGATPAFVRGPFLVAGVVQGLVASVLSVGLVEGVRRVALGWGNVHPAALLGLVAGSPLDGAVTLLLIGTGLLVGVVGAYLAVRGVRA